MTQLVPCPTCQTMNRPTQRRCRACGRSLPPAKGPAASVALQQVLGSEVFAAIVDPEPPNPSKDAHAESPAPDASSADEAGETSRFLASAAERLRERAASAGQRFKPYTATRSHPAERPQDKLAITRQLESAARAFREKHYDTAVEHLLKAIAKDDRDPRSWALLGQAYLRYDRPYKAAVGYLRVLELDPRNGSAWIGLARSFKAVGDLEGSRDVLSRAVQTSPDLTEAWSERGLVLETLGHRAEAAKSYSRALELQPDHRIAGERYEELARSEPPPPAPEEEEDLPDFADLAELPAKEEANPPPAEATRRRPARVHTYVEGLDEILSGGVPWGHVILVEGAPGTMKSTFGFSVLLQNAAREGMHGLYLSLKERTSSLFKQMNSAGLHLQVNRGSLVVLDPRAAKGLMAGRPDWVGALRSAVAAIQAQRGLDLIVLDSLDALEILANVQDRRGETFRLFEWLRDLDATSFVIAERPSHGADGREGPQHGDEHFLADGIFQLGQRPASDQDGERSLRVVKMRGTRHDLRAMALLLEDGRFRLTRRTA